jgi:Polyketide cyclase / dehydrase and lipid transport
VLRRPIESALKSTIGVQNAASHHTAACHCVTVVSKPAHHVLSSHDINPEKNYWRNQQKNPGHKVWRSKLPEVLEKGIVVESYVEVKGMPNRIKWTVVRYKPPQGMTLNGDGVGGVKVKLIAKVAPKGDGSVVNFDVHLGGPALFGPIGLIVAAALKTDIRESLQNFVRVFSGPQAQPDEFPPPGESIQMNRDN